MVTPPAVNKILPSMDATCFEAALTLKEIDYRFNIRSMSPEINVPDQGGFMSGWKPVDDMKEARMFGDIAREISLYTGQNTKDKTVRRPTSEAQGLHGRYTRGSSS